MAERKAQNKYYPPEWEPSKGSLNTFLKQHPLRDRARKLHMGILVIRFEMPFNVWCDTCQRMIGKGVRFNAEKKKVGNYYSTPIYSFAMKCPSCSGVMTIETDPKNCDYKLVSGVRRKEERWVPEETGSQPIMHSEDTAKLAADPMFRLEHNIADEIKAREKKPELARLIALQSRMDRDYDHNAALRKKFREEKKIIRAQENKDKALLERASLAIDLVPEHPSDVHHAAIVRYGPTNVDELQVKREALKRRSIFSKADGAGKRSKVAATATATKTPKDTALHHSRHVARMQAAQQARHETEGSLRAIAKTLVTPRKSADYSGRESADSNDEDDCGEGHGNQGRVAGPATERAWGGLVQDYGSDDDS